MKKQTSLLALGLSLALASPLSAAPMVIPHGQHDTTLAVAGTYTLDPSHVAVIAQVSHLGFSISVFRFGKVAATLDWDPAAIAK